MTSKWCIREAGPDERAEAVPTFFRHMWLDNNVQKHDILPDADQITRQFLHSTDASLRVLVCPAATAAGDSDGGDQGTRGGDHGTGGEKGTGGEIVGCAVCQLFSGLYPLILLPSKRCAPIASCALHQTMPQMQLCHLDQIWSERASMVLSRRINQPLCPKQVVLHAAPLRQQTVADVQYPPDMHAIETFYRRYIAYKR